MNTQRIAGAVLLIVGIVLLVVGMNASHSAADRWSNFFTGHFTDATVWYMVSGCAMGLFGLFMMLFGGSTKRAK